MRNIILLFLFLTTRIVVNAQSKSSNFYNDLSEDFLQTALLHENTQKFQDQLAQIDLDDLATSLENDTFKIAFWVNIYNAYIQVFLQKNASQFENKRAFFSDKQIAMFGKNISLEKIEHHIIRRSQWKFGFGNFKLLFRPKFERLLRLDKREPRVHFVLNCGAKSCPTTVVLRPETLEKQLEENTLAYLKKTTDYDKESNTVHLTPLFMWFRGDFGNKKGIKKMLAKYELIPADYCSVKIEKIEYDWSLDLSNWKDWR